MTPPLNSKLETLLHDLYFDQGIRLGRDKLWQASIAASPDEHPSRRQVQAWLFDQEEYQLDLPTRQTKSIRPFFAAHPYESVQVDLIDFTNKPSRQYRYILVAIDVFSRFVWAFPLTGKNVAATTRALEKLLGEMERKPRLVSNDSGPEFQGSFDALLKQRGIQHINGIPGRPESNGVVERVNGTLKKLILRNKAYKGLGWSDHLEEAVDNYNSLPHVTLGISPAEAISLSPTEQEDLATHHKTRKRKYKADTVQRLEVGDRVRLKVNKSRLEHYAVANWSEQVYTISKVSVPRRPFESISYKVAGKPQSYVYEDLRKIP